MNGSDEWLESALGALGGYDAMLSSHRCYVRCPDGVREMTFVRAPAKGEKIDMPDGRYRVLDVVHTPKPAGTNAKQQIVEIEVERVE